jgi:hypothetical protein
MIRRTSKEENDKIRALLNQKDEIAAKMKYYEGNLFACETLSNSIQERIDRGYNRETISILWLPLVHKTQKFDTYQVNKLLEEKSEVDYKIYCQKQYYESWLKRSKEYEAQFDEITRECNEHFDEVVEAAKEVAETNIRLAQSMSAYKNPKNDQQLKNEYFLYLKQETDNRREALSSKPKFQQKNG